MAKTQAQKTSPRVELSGSAKVMPASVKSAPAASAEDSVTVSVILKRKEPLNLTGASGLLRVTREEYAARFAADPHAVEAVQAFAAEYGLTVEGGGLLHARRTLRLTGTVAQMETAFGVTLKQKAMNGTMHRLRAGSIFLPVSLANLVVAVLGLDDRPQAKAHFRIRPAAAKGTSYTPVQVAQAYQFPTAASAAGETIAIIELGGGFRQADITAYFKSIGVVAPKVTAVLVDGGKNAPTTADGADGEVMLDIEVAGAVAPGAKLVVYFAPNTDQGFIDAISTAVHDTKNNPSVISISWGGPESSWTQQSLTALDAACQSAAALGITVTVASGDNGSGDGGTGNNVDFPASSPHVLACGGTSLVASGTKISSETVWNDGAQGGATGGGVSNAFALPAWQAKAGVPLNGAGKTGRGVPDVAGDADPQTGYTVRIDGQTAVIGGTSAVAPLWAGLIAVANKQLGTKVGLIQPAIYGAAGKGGFRDITQGNNGAFAAKAGWDACTGLGSPVAVKLIPMLGAGAGKKARK